MTIELKPLPPEEWDPSIKDIAEDMKGRPLNVHRLMANNPALLKAWWAFRNHSVTGGTLSRRQAEMVILRTAARLGLWYEWASHVERGLAVGLSVEEINRVRHEKSNEWPDGERLLITAVDEAMDQRAIGPATLEALGDYYSHPQILDILAIHGMYCILGTMIGTWGLELDDFIKLPEEILDDF